ncbi:MAG: sulfur carrier protein ThiS [Candidatus Anaerobiospirillum merdipullorum]|uniref:Sulfur carrier protein ThiS n=1 Tax=Candidatus Anaerobiospirillum merdipullorum TaxID=2838450 RepID=A0A9E2NUC8_9GAMM|nr:sulfur carrier protein ThiS [Candidatus Anaerobiospirillum merdipullorum]
MQIKFNGKLQELAHEQSLQQFLAERGIPADGTACAVNEEIVSKAQWATFMLTDGMQVDVFSLVAGG